VSGLPVVEGGTSNRTNNTDAVTVGGKARASGEISAFSAVTANEANSTVAVGSRSNVDSGVYSSSFVGGVIRRAMMTRLWRHIITLPTCASIALLRQKN
jgi:hypothetical protein